MAAVGTRVQMKCTVAQGGKCITGQGFRYTLSGKDAQMYGRQEWWGKEITVTMDLTPRGSVEGGSIKAVKSSRSMQMQK